MSPAELTSQSFKSYPDQGRKLALDSLELLRQLPLCFVPFLLKELVAYDWKFPAEKNELQQQLTYFRTKTPKEQQKAMAAFRQMRLSSQLQRFDWVKTPAQFLESLSVHLWATNQINAFRKASESYLENVRAQFPPIRPVVPRLVMAVIGKGVGRIDYTPFRKLRQEGTYFSKLQIETGSSLVLQALIQRAEAHPLAYGHWYIEGGTNLGHSCNGLTCVSYEALGSARKLLSEKIREAYESLSFRAEALRTMLARIGPEDFGVHGGDPVLERFKISTLTEGSGTQIFSTTFVQWASREALRRAQPLTLLARFSPRQRERPMKDLLSQVPRIEEVDPLGSLVDADAGAYLTWINQQRLSGAETSSFLVWFEDHPEAVAIGPSFPKGTEYSKPISLERLLGTLA